MQQQFCRRRKAAALVRWLRKVVHHHCRLRLLHLARQQGLLDLVLLLQSLRLGPWQLVRPQAALLNRRPTQLAPERRHNLQTLSSVSRWERHLVRRALQSWVVAVQERMAGSQRCAGPSDQELLA